MSWLLSLSLSLLSSHTHSATAARHTRWRAGLAAVAGLGSFCWSGRRLWSVEAAVNKHLGVRFIETFRWKHLKGKRNKRYHDRFLWNKCLSTALHAREKCTLSDLRTGGAQQKVASGGTGVAVGLGPNHCGAGAGVSGVLWPCCLCFVAVAH